VPEDRGVRRRADRSRRGSARRSDGGASVCRRRPVVRFVFPCGSSCSLLFPRRLRAAGRQAALVRRSFASGSVRGPPRTRRGKGEERVIKPARRAGTFDLLCGSDDFAGRVARRITVWPSSRPPSGGTAKRSGDFPDQLRYKRVRVNATPRARTVRCCGPSRPDGAGSLSCAPCAFFTCGSSCLGLSGARKLRAEEVGRRLARAQA